MSYRLAIIGFPLGHTLSPHFHTEALTLCGLDGSYEALETSPSLLDTTWQDRIRRSYDGLNVTIPHKVSIIPLLDDLSESARAVGAVNTIVREGDRWIGHNTDVTGFEQSLLPHKEKLKGATVALVGAGGAARAAVAALLGTFFAGRILLINRTIEKAEALAATSGLAGTAMQIICTDDPELSKAVAECSLVVQATSVGMDPNHDDSPLPEMDVFSPDQIVFDLIYRPRETRFLRDAKAAGAHTIGGLEMFLRQAMASFELWTGKTPPLEIIRPLIEERLKRP